MTKKDYELIAGTINDYIFVNEADRSNALAIAEMLADSLYSDNPKFDRQRFLTACGIQTEPEIGICGCDDNESLIVGETCDECGQIVRSEQD